MKKKKATKTLLAKVYREQYMLAEVIKVAARCANAVFSSSDETAEEEYDRLELDVVANALCDGQSEKQLESLSILVELALRGFRKDKAGKKNQVALVDSVAYDVTPSTKNSNEPEYELVVFKCSTCRRVSAIDSMFAGQNVAPINCPHCLQVLRVAKS